MTIATITENLPDARRVLRWMLLVVGISVFLGTFLFHVFLGMTQIPDRWPILLKNILYSFIYTVTMLGSLTGAAQWLRARIPLHSRRAVALHVGGLSAVTVLSYGLATGICWVLYPDQFGLDWRLLFVTATIAFLVTAVVGAFLYMRTFYEQLREAEAARYEARLEALRAQINPHFLFNAFNSIAALIRTRPDEAETVVEDLADLFRYALRSSKDDTATLAQEIDAARRYLSVEKARFRGRLAVEVEVPEGLRSVFIPSMTLQPLVENAVKHGVGETQKSCTVTVTAEQADGTLVLRVLDTGPGFETTDLDAVLDEGSGLANVRERLRLFFDEAAQMHLRAQGVELWIPLDADVEATPTAASAMAEAG